MPGTSTKFDRATMAFRKSMWSPWWGRCGAGRKGSYRLCPLGAGADDFHFQWTAAHVEAVDRSVGGNQQAAVVAQLVDAGELFFLDIDKSPTGTCAQHHDLGAHGQ